MSGTGKRVAPVKAACLERSRRHAPPVKRKRDDDDSSEDEADAEFWNQDFFAEEQEDVDYESEKEEVDKFDSDFDESEDDDEGEDFGDVKDDVKKKKTLKPPGYKPKKKPPSALKKKATAAGQAPKTEKKVKSVSISIPPEPGQTRSLRQSTQEQTEEADAEHAAQKKAAAKKKAPAPQPVKYFTQEEVLAEAARTELDNIASFDFLMAREEEIKKKAHVEKAKFRGPLMKKRTFCPVRVRGGEGVEATVLHTRTFENMPDGALPPGYAAATAPEPAARVKCAATGKPARYKDPVTSDPFASVAAFVALRTQAREGGPPYTVPAPFSGITPADDVEEPGEAEALRSGAAKKLAAPAVAAGPEAFLKQALQTSR